MKRRLGIHLPRRPPRSVLVCAALLACLAVASLVLGLRGSFGPTPHAAKPMLSAKATLSSRSMLFGDTIGAQLELILPRGTSRDDLHVRPNFRPFKVVSTNVERESLGGGLERISLRYRLTCLWLRCVSGRPITHLRFEPTSVSIPGLRVRAVWPPLVEVSRALDVSAPVADELDSVPAVSNRLESRRDAYEALVACAIALVLLLSGWLYLRRRARRRVEAATRRWSDLQAILARVEAGLPEDFLYRQRHALDALAVELRHLHVDGSLAVRAERLAWAPEEPDNEEIRALCAQVRRRVKR